MKDKYGEEMLAAFSPFDDGDERWRCPVCNSQRVHICGIIRHPRSSAKPLAAK
jgi:hypothetical protein